MVGSEAMEEDDVSTSGETHGLGNFTEVGLTFLPAGNCSPGTLSSANPAIAFHQRASCSEDSDVPTSRFEDAREDPGLGRFFGLDDLVWQMGFMRVEGCGLLVVARGGEPCALRHNSMVQLGNTTVSMTWMTPLLAATSVLMTLALSTVTAPSATFTSRDLPLTVLAFIVFTSAAMTLPATTW